MTVLSLFDGMGCGVLAMMESGVPMDRYVAYEKDKYAKQTSKHNFPFIEHRGDVFKADFTEFEGFDWLIAGFPCTKFSIAQKNDRETQPYQGEGWDLFWHTYEAINIVKPKYFLLENNKSMAKAVQEEISRLIGFKPVLINSALVSAQNRQRLYWVGKMNDDGTYSKVDVPQPEDRGILLKDILETGCDLPSCEKAYCLTASYNGACAWNTIERNQRTMIAEPLTPFVEKKIDEIADKYGYLPETFNPYNTSEITDKAPALTTGCNRHTSSATVMITEPVRVGCMPSPDGEVKNSQAFRVYDSEGKSINLSANGGGAGGKTGLYAVPINTTADGKSQTIKAQYQRSSPANILGYTSTYGASGVAEHCPCFAIPTEWDEEGRPTKARSCADGKIYTVYEVKDGKITIKGKEYPIKLPDGFYIIRKLTVRECMRLQTVPEWYEFPVSDSQAYKMLGNGWTVLCISHIINCALR